LIERQRSRRSQAHTVALRHIDVDRALMKFVVTRGRDGIGNVDDARRDFIGGSERHAEADFALRNYARCDGRGIHRDQSVAPIVDPRPYAVGSIRETFERYPKTGALLPAMGYGAKQIAELEATINAAPVDLVLIATPIDLRRIVNIRHPTLRVRYELKEIGPPTVAEILQQQGFRTAVAGTKAVAILHDRAERAPGAPGLKLQRLHSLLLRADIPRYLLPRANPVHQPRSLCSVDRRRWFPLTFQLSRPRAQRNDRVREPVVGDHFQADVTSSVPDGRLREHLARVKGFALSDLGYQSVAVAQQAVPVDQRIRGPLLTAFLLW
jgi:hypothetical protein